jgi:exodeoxyribonuclease V gamma subunit
MDLRFDAIPADEAGRYLAALLHLYQEGLRRPVPFFRKTSWVYVDQGLNAARNRWAGKYGGKSKAESEDVWHALAWRGAADPLDDRFKEIADLVFGPIIGQRILLDRQP